MKTPIPFIAFLLFPAITAFSQAPPIQWDKTYGGNNYEEFDFIKQTSDGGYISGGWSQSPISGSKSQANWDASNGTPDYWIVKSDANGIKQWDKRFGGTAWESFSYLQQTTDGGYILGGYSGSSANGDKSQTSRGANDYWIIKISATGIKQWDARFGGSSDDYLYCVIQTSDHGYMLCGFSNSGASGDKTQGSQGGGDYWIVKTDSLGVKQWDKRFGGSLDDYAYSVVQTSDGGYMIAGTSSSGLSGDHSQNNRGVSNSMDYWVVKTDASGTKEWDKRFGTADNDLCVIAPQTSDGGYILGGYSDGTVNGDRSVNSRGMFDYWLVKIDATGNKLWDKRYGGSDHDYLYALEITTDGGFILGGTSYSGSGGDKTQPSRGNEDYWIIKTDASGTLQWDKTMGGSGSDWLADIYQTSDGYYVCGGWSTSGISGEKTQASVSGSSDFWVIKLGITVLPVELTSFDADAKENFIHLTWITASETNNSGFELQRSPDATNFEKVGWMNGQGSATSVTNYSYDDRNVQPEKIYYYRLKQLDFNGEEKYSAIIDAKITTGKSLDLVIAGNPVQQSATISWYLTDDDHVQIILTDATGRRIHILKNSNEAKGEHFLILDKNSLNLSQGIYFLTLSTPSQIITQKLVVE